jgi:chorismate--pyruvate lyase
VWHNFLVKTQYSNRQQRSQWLKKPMMSGLYRDWLLDKGSLTLRLQQRYVDFSVHPSLVVYAKPFVNEAMLLKMALHKTAHIREVMLMGNHHAVVFAHSVLPRESLRGRWLGLSCLGNKPLGASLFANPQVLRTPLSYKKLSRHHLLFKHATQHLHDKPDYLWARRSVFRLNRANMIVTEVFLPRLLQV